MWSPAVRSSSLLYGYLITFDMDTTINVDRGRDSAITGYILIGVVEAVVCVTYILLTIEWSSLRFSMEFFSYHRLQIENKFWYCLNICGWTFINTTGLSN